MPAGRPLKFSSPDEVMTKGLAYFDYCDSNSKPKTITGLALALDTTRETLMDYQNKDEFSDTIKALKLRCENYAEEQVFVGKNQAGAIFALKNYGWRDKNETDITSNGQSLGVITLPTLNGTESSLGTTTNTDQSIS